MAVEPIPLINFCFQFRMKSFRFLNEVSSGPEAFSWLDIKKKSVYIHTFIMSIMPTVMIYPV